MGIHREESIYDAGYMLSSLVRLVPMPGICSLPSCDWFRCRVYALFPRAIGSDAGYMLASLVRLVPMPGICSRPAYLITNMRKQTRRWGQEGRVAYCTTLVVAEGARHPHRSP
eukprot:1676630-Pyramimonas_sp.AAC.1